MKLLPVLCVLLLGVALPVAAEPAGPTPVNWSMNASAIEACSCPVFCQCFFSTSPAAHDGHHMEGHEMQAEHYCRFNNAYLVNHGLYGNLRLDGAKFWIYGDLGSDFSKGETDWAVVTFDRKTTPAQRAALGEILAHLYPVKWRSLTTAEGDIQWTPGKEVAWATLDGGETAEIRLQRFAGMTKDPVVIQNLRYFGATHNDGFILMPSVVETLRTGDKAFEFHGTNGFMITLDINSKGTQTAKAVE